MTDVLIEAFMDAIRERLDAEEFERLMLGKRARGLSVLDDNLDLIALMRGDEQSALADLKASRALEGLQARYPELWEQAVMSVEAVDA